MNTKLDPTEYEKISKYALEVSDKSLHEQYVEVQSVRQRASYLVAVNALSVALFIRLLPEDTTVDSLAWVAGCLWFSSVVLCLLTMLPMGRWRLYQSGEDILKQFTEGDGQLPARKAFAVMAILRDRDIVANEPLVRRSHSLFFFAACSTITQVLAWSLKVAQASS